MRKTLSKMLSLTLMAMVLLSGISFAAFWNSKPTIVTTIYPLYDFTKQVVGDKANVILLVPAGAEPHDWEPAPSDLVTIKKADLFIYNGAGMEVWIDKLQGSVLEGKRVLRASDYVTVLSAQYTEDGAPAPMGAIDPHIWLDLANARLIVNGITTAVTEIDGDNADYYTNNSSNYVAQIQALHEEYSQSLSRASQLQIITSHAAFGYMAHRYGLQQIAIMGIQPDAEPTAQRMGEIINYVKANGIKYIFTETLISPRLSETIAKESGAQTLVLNPIEGLTDDEIAQGESYLSQMKLNLVNLKHALGAD